MSSILDYFYFFLKKKVFYKFLIFLKSSQKKKIIDGDINKYKHNFNQNLKLKIEKIKRGT
jgi:hypothetical protein